MKLLRINTYRSVDSGRLRGRDKILGKGERDKKGN
jgi:hypothetical protein